jgi:hypothetical protein
VLIGNISTTTSGAAGNFYSTTTIAHNFGTVPRLVRVWYTGQGDSSVDNWTRGFAVATSTSASNGSASCMGGNADTANGARVAYGGGQLGVVYAGENTNARCGNAYLYGIYLVSLTSTQAQIEVRYVSGKGNGNADITYEIVQ